MVGDSSANLPLTAHLEVPDHERVRLALAAAGTAAATLLAVSLPVTAQAGATAGGGLVVRTDRGLIQGKPAEGTDQFLGVPYAAPPVGALRWAAPQPAAALARDPPGHVLRRPVRPAGQRQRPPGGQRGLPVPQRVHAARRGPCAAAGATGSRCCS